MKLTTDFIRAAVEGKTADGRAISALQIDQMAKSYNQDIYNARIWPEHIRGIMPDGLFKALGDVIKVKAEKIKGGDLDGKLALYVKIEPHPDLITMVRSGQKVHLSIEMHPEFPSTNGAYLMGLGVTDSPASLGTGIMQFSTQGRKESLFSEPVDIATQEQHPEERLEWTAPQGMETFNDALAGFRHELRSVREERTRLQEQLTAEREQHKSALATKQEQHLKALSAKDAEIFELQGRIPKHGFKVVGNQPSLVHEPARRAWL